MTGQKLTWCQVVPPSEVRNSCPGRWVELPSPLAGPCTTTPSVAVVKPRSAQPTPPSYCSFTIRQVTPPLPEWNSQLAALAVAMATSPVVVAAIVPPSPAGLGVPAAAQWAPSSSLT